MQQETNATGIASPDQTADDTDKKLPANDNDKKLPADDNKKKLPPFLSNGVYAQGELRHMRCAYGDAFLSRCDSVDSAALTLRLPLQLGTYICPWMPQHPKEETHFEAGNAFFGSVRKTRVKCRSCGIILDEQSDAARDHVLPCYEAKKESLVRPMQPNSNDIVAIEEFTIAIEEYTLAIENQTSYLRNPWERLEDPGPREDEKDLEYWASNCLTKDLYLHGAALSRRPDIHCSTEQTQQTGYKPNNFGAHSFQASLLSSNAHIFPGFAPCAMQATWVPYDTTLSPEYPYSSDGNNRYRLGLHFTKDAVWMYNQRQTWRDDDQEVLRPFTPSLRVPSNGVNSAIMERIAATGLKMQQHGGPESDVWTLYDPTIATSINPILDDFASVNNDRPLPRYQMIIDPNLFVRTRKKDQKKVWVPCEFDISPDGSRASLVGGDRAHLLDSKLIDSVATPVLTKALPLLAKLKKPYILLEGQRLQVVVKAQSITVPQKQPNDDPPEYIGLWHVDGEHEPVVAVVLYYYNVDDAIVGGNMEFMDRRPISVLGSGDTDMDSEIPSGALSEAIRPSTDATSPLLPNCSVPTKTGSLFVFSNYQMAHRVLRMLNTSENRPASRKFVALFVLDPAADPLVPARWHLARSYLYRRALTGKLEGLAAVNAGGTGTHQDSFPETVATLILEFLGILPSLPERRQTRNELLRSQLLPKQSLAMSGAMVCGTGNGCLTMLGWLDSLLVDSDRKKTFNSRDDFKKAEQRVNALNYPPKNVGRGLSETFSTPTDDLEDDFATCFMDTLDERNEQLNADFDRMLLQQSPPSKKRTNQAVNTSQSTIATNDGKSAKIVRTNDTSINLNNNK